MEVVQCEEGDNVVEIAVNEQEDQDQFPSDNEVENSDVSDVDYSDSGEEGELREEETDKSEEDEMTINSATPPRKVIRKEKEKAKTRRSMEQKIDELSQTVKSMQEIMKAQQFSLSNQAGSKLKSVVTAIPK